MTEAERKRREALETAGPFVTSDPADVRWLLCGRGPTSLNRIVSFGSPPEGLARVARAAAEVDARILAESRPGRTLGELFGVLVRAYEDQSLPDEWRRHHQGGLTGYAGREGFATPADETVLPDTCAVAWNPSVTGGGKSEDTALVRHTGVEVLTRTPDLPEIEPAVGPPRAAIVPL